MGFKFLDPDEDHDFAEGETVYDADSNIYVVECHRAVLRRGNQSVSYFLGDTMKLCFTRKVPPAFRCWGCGITVLPSSDNTTGLCTGCEKRS